MFLCLLCKWSYLSIFMPLYLCPGYRKKLSGFFCLFVCFTVICSQSLTHTMHGRDSWLMFFRDVVVVQLLVFNNLQFCWCHEKSAVNQVNTYSLEYLTGEDGKRCTAEAQVNKARYWIVFKTEIRFISSDIMLCNGSSDMELVYTEKIYVLMGIV